MSDTEQTEDNSAYRAWVSFTPQTPDKVMTPEGHKLAQALKAAPVSDFTIIRAGKTFGQKLQAQVSRSASEEQINECIKEIKNAVQDFAKAKSVSVVRDRHGFFPTATFTPYRD